MAARVEVGGGASTGWKSTPNSMGRSSAMARSASSRSYSGRGWACREKPFLRANAVSSSCSFALSRRMIGTRAAVLGEQYTGPSNPSRTSAGR